MVTVSDGNLVRMGPGQVHTDKYSRNRGVDGGICAPGLSLNFNNELFLPASAEMT